jgi:thiamine-phosphate pyrophosphorylase
MKTNVLGIHILLSALSVNGRSPGELAQIAVDGGASVIQLREKEMPMDELLPIAKRIRNICRDITFIVNDRADLAKIVEADGMHLGQEDLPIDYARDLLGEKSIIGISCGSVDQAIEAEKKYADYIGFGHMYPTSSKIKSSPPKSLKELEAVCTSIKIPVIAIGGITVDNTASLYKRGASGIAVLSSFSQSQNPKSVIERFSQIYRNESL